MKAVYKIEEYMEDSGEFVFRATPANIGYGTYKNKIFIEHDNHVRTAIKELNVLRRLGYTMFDRCY